MSIPPSDQPIEALRESTIDQLVMNYGHNKLSAEAFDRRLEQAMDATDQSQLVALTEDLDLKVDQQYLDKKHETFGREYESEEPKDVDYMFNIMGGSTRRGEWEVPREIRMINIMGGGEIDFSEAIFPPGISKLKIYCLMGGAAIKVPDGIRVKSKVFSLMGGYDDQSPSSSSKEGPTLVIEGMILMGGAEVKVKYNMKKRLRDFGNSIRTRMTPSNANDTEKSIRAVK